MYKVLDDEERTILNHQSYNRLTDDIFYLGSDVVLRMNVILYVVDIKNKKRYFYHKEVGHIDNDHNLVFRMKRSFDYYLSLENYLSDSKGEKLFIQIRLHNMYMLRQTLSSALVWLDDPRYDSLFTHIGGTLDSIPKAMSAIKLTINNLPMGNFIVLCPCFVIKTFEGQSIQSKGIRMFFAYDKYIDLSARQFQGFTQSIMDINLFNAAQQMLSYFGRPPYGCNNIVVGDNLSEQFPKEKRPVKKRHIGDNREENTK